jgi:superoxide reductase
MAERLQVYKCEMCGNIVEVLHGGKGELFCCGEPMNLMEEQTADASQEKHVPVIDQSEGKIDVKVGSVPHPMEAEHHIEWIQIMFGGNNCRIFLAPGKAPEAVFTSVKEDVVAREYCNVHRLWRS